MRSVTRQFEDALAKVVFPADIKRAELRTLCRAMFDAGRRSLRNEKHRQAVAARAAHCKEVTS